MADHSAAIPLPEPDDADDVAMALETAKALWGMGDKQEAVRWLRRAAEAAEQAENDLRAVRLARTAAELASELQNEPSAGAPAPSMPPPPPTPSAAPPPRAPPSRAPPPPPPAPVRVASAEPTEPAAFPLKPRSRPPPPPSAAATSRAPTPPSAAATSRAPTPPAPAPSPPAPATSAAPSAKSQRPPPAPSTPKGQVAQKSRPAPKADKPAAPVPSVAGSEHGADVWHAIRVSVKPSAREPGLFIVRRLENGKTPPPEAREALIVVMDQGEEFFRAIKGES